MRKHDKAARIIILVRNILLVLYAVLALADGWLGWGSLAGWEGADRWPLAPLNTLLAVDLFCLVCLSFCARCLRREESVEGSMMSYGKEGAVQSYTRTEAVGMSECPARRSHQRREARTVQVKNQQIGRAHV